MSSARARRKRKQFEKAGVKAKQVSKLSFFGRPAKSASKSLLGRTLQKLFSKLRKIGA